VSLNYLPLLLIAAFAPIASYAQTDFGTYDDPYFGITIQRPAEWYIEGDNPWNHAHISPWHLPLIPIKELQPTAVDILLEGKKTLIASIEPADESGAYMQLSVEKMPFGTTLDSYIDHTLARLQMNNDNLKVEELNETTLDGNPAIRLVITTGDANESRTIQVISLYGNLAYILQYGAAAEDYGMHLPTFQRVVESADINPPVSYAQMLLLPMAGAGVASAAVIAFKARKRNSYMSRFLAEAKRMLAPALSIEVLCVASAEVGGLLGLYYFGFNPLGITMAYVLAYALAGFTTFASILGRSSGAHDHEEEIICGCGPGHDSGFKSNFVQTFANFAAGLRKMTALHKEPDAWRIVKASLIVLVSAESGCIVAAATVDVMLYQYSMFLSIPAALLAGTLTVAFIAARRSLRRRFVEQPS
jgi:citrate lyase gamma subunit